MRDFSLDIYRELLETLQAKGYAVITYADYCHGNRPEKFVILRHDVDAKPLNSVRTAQMEQSMDIRATYYFRVGKTSNVPDVIRTIANLGHEIGYHYEDMSICHGDVEAAWNHFKTWLRYFRTYYPVETICMHGAPTSKWDSKDLWKKYNYKTQNIIGEPYMDTDFSDVFYLTDTGRCWDGYKVSVRDKIPQFQDEWIAKGLVWHTTKQLLLAIEEDKLPNHVMITTHPQRWTNNRKSWLEELISQALKNMVKRMIMMKYASETIH